MRKDEKKIGRISKEAKQSKAKQSIDENRRKLQKIGGEENTENKTTIEQVFIIILLQNETIDF